MSTISKADGWRPPEAPRFGNPARRSANVAKMHTGSLGVWRRLHPNAGGRRDCGKLRKAPSELTRRRRRARVVAVACRLACPAPPAQRGDPGFVQFFIRPIPSSARSRCGPSLAGAGVSVWAATKSHTLLPGVRVWLRLRVPRCRGGVAAAVGLEWLFGLGLYDRRPVRVRGRLGRIGRVGAGCGRLAVGRGEVGRGGLWGGARSCRAAGWLAAWLGDGARAGCGAWDRHGGEVLQLTGEGGIW